MVLCCVVLRAQCLSVAVLTLGLYSPPLSRGRLPCAPRRQAIATERHFVEFFHNARAFLRENVDMWTPPAAAAASDPAAASSSGAAQPIRPAPLLPADLEYRRLSVAATLPPLSPFFNSSPFHGNSTGAAPMG